MKKIKMFSFFALLCLTFIITFSSGRASVHAEENAIQYLYDLCGGELSSDSLSGDHLDIYNNFVEGKYPLRLAYVRGNVTNGQLTIISSPVSCGWEDVDHLCLLPYNNTYVFGYSSNGTESDKFNCCNYGIQNGVLHPAGVSSCFLPINYLTNAGFSGSAFYQITGDLELVDDENPLDWQSFMTPKYADPKIEPDEPSIGTVSSIPSLVSSAFGNVKANVISLIVSAVPYALIIIGIILAVLTGIRVFKKLVSAG